MGSLLYQVGLDWHTKVAPMSSYDDRYSDYREKLNNWRTISI